MLRKGNNLNAKPVTRDEFIRLMSNKNSPEYNAWHGIVQPSTTHIPAGEEFGDAPYYQISSEGGRSGYVFNIDGQKVYLDSNNVSDPDESYRKLYNSVKMPELIDKTQKWEDHERVQGALNQLNLQRNDDLLYQASKAIASTQNIPYGQEFDAGSPVTTYSETPTELPPEVQNVVDQSLGKTTVDNIGDQLKVPPLRNTEDGSLDRGIHARPEVFMNPPNQNIVRPSPFGPKETNIPMGTPVPAMSNVG